MGLSPPPPDHKTPTTSSSSSSAHVRESKVTPTKPQIVLASSSSPAKALSHDTGVNGSGMIPEGNSNSNIIVVDVFSWFGMTSLGSKSDLAAQVSSSADITLATAVYGDAYPSDDTATAKAAANGEDSKQTEERALRTTIDIETETTFGNAPDADDATVEHLTEDEFSGGVANEEVKNTADTDTPDNDNYDEDDPLVLLSTRACYAIESRDRVSLEINAEINAADYSATLLCVCAITAPALLLDLKRVIKWVIQFNAAAEAYDVSTILSLIRAAESEGLAKRIPAFAKTLSFARKYAGRVRNERSLLRELRSALSVGDLPQCEQLSERANRLYGDMLREDMRESLALVDRLREQISKDEDLLSRVWSAVESRDSSSLCSVRDDLAAELSAAKRASLSLDAVRMPASIEALSNALRAVQWAMSLNGAIEAQNDMRIKSLIRQAEEHCIASISASASTSVVFARKYLSRKRNINELHAKLRRALENCDLISLDSLENSIRALFSDLVDDGLRYTLFLAAVLRTQITRDEELLERVAQAVESRDGNELHTVIDELRDILDRAKSASTWTSLSSFLRLPAPSDRIVNANQIAVWAVKLNAAIEAHDASKIRALISIADSSDFVNKMPRFSSTLTFARKHSGRVITERSIAGKLRCALAAADLDALDSLVQQATEQVGDLIKEDTLEALELAKRLKQQTADDEELVSRLAGAIESRDVDALESALDEAIDTLERHKSASLSLDASRLPAPVDRIKGFKRIAEWVQKFNSACSRRDGSVIEMLVRGAEISDFESIMPSFTRTLYSARKYCHRSKQERSLLSELRAALFSGDMGHADARVTLLNGESVSDVLNDETKMEIVFYDRLKAQCDDDDLFIARANEIIASRDTAALDALLVETQEILQAARSASFTSDASSRRLPYPTESLDRVLCDAQNVREELSEEEDVLSLMDLAVERKIILDLKDAVGLMGELKKEFPLSDRAVDTLATAKDLLNDLLAEEHLIFDLESAAVSRISVDIDSAIAMSVDTRFKHSDKLLKSLQWAKEVREELRVDEDAIASLERAVASKNVSEIKTELSKIKALKFRLSYTLQANVKHAERVLHQLLADDRLREAVQSKDMEKLNDALAFASLHGDVLENSTSTLVAEATLLRKILIAERWRKNVEEAQKERNYLQLRACLEELDRVEIEAVEEKHILEIKEYMARIYAKKREEIFRDINWAIVARSQVDLQAAMDSAADIELSVATCEQMSSAAVLCGYWDEEDRLIQEIKTGVENREIFRLKLAIEQLEALRKKTELSSNGVDAMTRGTQYCSQIITEDGFISQLETAITCRNIGDLDHIITEALRLPFNHSTLLDETIQRAITVQEEISMDRKAVLSLRIATASQDPAIILDVVMMVKSLSFPFSDTLADTLEEAERVHHELVSNNLFTRQG